MASVRIEIGKVYDVVYRSKKSGDEIKAYPNAEVLEMNGASFRVQLLDHVDPEQFRCFLPERIISASEVKS